MYLGKGNACATTNPIHCARELNQNQQKTIPVIWDKQLDSSPRGEMEIRGSNLALHLPKFFSMMAEERKGLKAYIRGGRRLKVKAFVGTKQTLNPSGKLSHCGLYLWDSNWTCSSKRRILGRCGACSRLGSYQVFKYGSTGSAKHLSFTRNSNFHGWACPAIWTAKFTWTKVNLS